MSEDGKNILVGVLALIGLGLLASASIGGKSIGAATSGYLVNASFNRIDGLNLGDDVRMSGIKIGEVARLRLGSNFAAVVEMRIDSGIELPSDTSAAIHTDGLFGSKHVSLVPGAEDAMLKPGGRIDLTQDSVVVTDLLDLIIGEAKANAAKREAKDKASAPAAPAPFDSLLPKLDTPDGAAPVRGDSTPDQHSPAPNAAQPKGMQP